MKQIHLISSKIIADITKKNHGDVMADIRIMCKQADIKITSKPFGLEVDSQEVIVIENTYMVKIGYGAERPVKEYLLNDMAAETLALGYDVKRRIKILQLIKEMKAVIEKQTKALEIKPTLAINSSCTLTDIVSEYNDKNGSRATSNRKINKILRTNNYFRPNYQPYEKWINQGLFMYVLYNPIHSAKQLRISEKGKDIILKLLNPVNQLQTSETNNVPALKENNQVVPLPMENQLSQYIKEMHDDHSLLFENQYELDKKINVLKETAILILETMWSAKGEKEISGEKESLKDRTRIFLKTLHNL